MKYLALVTFIIVYLAFVVFPRHRALSAAIGGLFVIMVGVLSPYKAFTAIEWNVMGIFIGTLILADLFMYSRMPAYLAEWIVNLAGRVSWALLLLCLLTSLMSAFLENVATVLIIAPVALSITTRLRISPIIPIIALAISSNLQGTATLIGDPPSMLLGTHADMDFNDFFFYQGRLSIFWFVELGALASFVVLYLFFKPHGKKVALPRTETIKSYVPTILLIAFVLTLVTTSFVIQDSIAWAGIISMVYAIIALLWYVLLRRESLWQYIKTMDWHTTTFLLGVFVLVGGLVHTHWIDTIADNLAIMVGDNVFLAFLTIMVVSVAISAFVDNVPYLIAMLSVAMRLAADLEIDPPLLLFALLIGSCLGGNITPIGASANVVSMGILRKQGYIMPFGTFVKIGLPFTVAAVGAATIFLWLVWGQ